MINFEEELKKFRPSLEVEDAEESIYNQDLTDMADLLVRMLQEVQQPQHLNHPWHHNFLWPIAYKCQCASLDSVVRRP